MLGVIVAETITYLLLVEHMATENIQLHQFRGVATMQAGEASASLKIW